MNKSTNLLKVLGWFFLYFIIQTVSTLGYMIYALFTSKNNFIESGNISTQQIEELMDSLMGADTLMSCLLISSMITLIVGVIIIQKGNSEILNKITYKKTTFCLCIGITLNYITSLALSLVPVDMMKIYDAHVNALTGGSIILELLTVGIVGPIVEEIIFRYGITGNLVKINKIGGIIVGSLIFGLMHGQPIQIGYAFVIGLILAYVYIKSNNLWYSIYIHIGVNMSSVIVSRLLNDNIIGFSIVTIVAGFLAIIIHKTSMEKETSL